MRSSPPIHFMGHSDPSTEPVQFIIYGPGEPEVIEGEAERVSEGTIELHLPLSTPPEEGTVVQVVLYPSREPKVIEGVIGPIQPDGSFEILITG